MLIVDAHLDLSWNALQWGRDLTRSAYTIRTQENTTPGKGRGLGTVAYPEMRQGRIALCFATLLARSTGQPVPHVDYAAPAQSYGIAQGQLAYYRALERTREARIIADLAGLEQHIAEWEAWEREQMTGGMQNDHRSSLIVHRAPPLGFVISMEGADPIAEPEQLAEWYDAGLRLLGLTHYGPGRYAGGTATELGLTELGPPLLAEMARLGVVLDLTHCSDQSFWQALERYDGPAIASHNNCRALVPHQRQFDDDQLRAIAARDGVIGAALDAWMLKPGWSIGAPSNPTVTLSDVADQIDYICQLTGSSRHAAIGSDLDGGFGREQSPQDLDTITDLQKLAGLLAARGYGPDDIAAIMHGNWLRLLRRVWAD
jgi:membrane dipeptidase